MLFSPCDEGGAYWNWCVHLSAFCLDDVFATRFQAAIGLKHCPAVEVGTDLRVPMGEIGFHLLVLGLNTSPLFRCSLPSWPPTAYSIPAKLHPLLCKRVPWWMFFMFCEHVCECACACMHACVRVCAYACTYICVCSVHVCACVCVNPSMLFSCIEIQYCQKV